ncbi:energy-coupling factor ABC transporter ATP-binding protein [Tropicimonas sp. IMCC34043]|uniref:energy-coupling factor ABC transporter ATP-binding protein n=1 Tax=Tropicimonas sp. IMCC34043 TaxID=2248760 RepID=UPI000E23210D|nr:ABC transporter ATP-binding protein [Tropicimonas sp. IMCC34043]
MNAPLLDLRAVGFAYGETPVLRDISFAVHPGEVVALVGRNGAGKSTMLRLLNGLLRPDAGTVLIDGADTADRKVSELARTVGTVFQAPEQQIFNATVRSEIAFGPAQLNLGEDALQARIAEAVARTGLEGLLDTHPLDLDAATRRFVAIASVLACAPRLLLLDEAQRGLDRQRRARLADIIAEERAAGRAIVLVCHDMDFVADTADRVLGLAGGLLAVDATVRRFFADEQAPHSVSVERPQIAVLAAALGLPVALTPAELVARLVPTMEGDADASDH